MSADLRDLRRSSTGAFTLIELLVVVAIISILSAIAVPNFLEAQTRAKVSRVKNDQRSMVTALESYALDHNKYPPRKPSPVLLSFTDAIGEVAARPRDLARLTTPIAYMTSVPIDIFENTLAPPYNQIDYWDNLILFDLGVGFRNTPNFPSTHRPVAPEAEWRAGRWGLVSVGPDGLMGISAVGQGGSNPGYPYLSAQHISGSLFSDYDPTNGTVSTGNVYRFQKDVPALLGLTSIEPQS